MLGGILCLKKIHQCQNKVHLSSIASQYNVFYAQILFKKNGDDRKRRYNQDKLNLLDFYLIQNFFHLWKISKRNFVQNMFFYWIKVLKSFWSLKTMDSRMKQCEYGQHWSNGRVCRSLINATLLEKAQNPTTSFI